MTTAATGPGGHMAMRSHDTEESDAEEDEFGMKIRERAGKFLRIYCIVITIVYHNVGSVSNNTDYTCVVN